MDFKLEYKGITLDAVDMIYIQDQYKRMLVAALLMERYGIKDKKEALEFAEEVVRLSEYCHCSEELIIEQKLQESKGE